MAAFRVTPAHDPAIQIEFEVPIKGRPNPLHFSVPRLQYFAPDTSKAFNAWLIGKDESESRDNAATGEAEGSAPAARNGRQIIEKLLELNTSAKDFAILKKLTDGELLQINEHWESASRVPLGESSTSSDT